MLYQKIEHANILPRFHKKDLMVPKRVSQYLVSNFPILFHLKEHLICIESHVKKDQIKHNDTINSTMISEGI